MVDILKLDPKPYKDPLDDSEMVLDVSVRKHK